MKYWTIVVFQHMLYLKKLPLQKIIEQHRKLNVFAATPVPQIIVNTPHLVNLKRKREYSIDMRKASIRNHRVGL
jgi:hypothetical protein